MCMCICVRACMQSRAAKLSGPKQSQLNKVKQSSDKPELRVCVSACECIVKQMEGRVRLSYLRLAYIALEGRVRLSLSLFIVSLTALPYKYEL